MLSFGTIFFLGYVLFAVLLIYTLLFGESEFHRRGYVGACHRFITSGLWVQVKRLGPKLCGKAMFRKCASCSDWLWNKPNPVMQIFYLILVVGGSSMMMYSGFEHLPGPYLSSIHLYTFPAWLAFVVGFFFFTSRSNPGRVTKENWELYNSIFPCDNVIYGPGFCKTCRHPKIPRAKHCSICGYDSARHDHHCPWINNCVGLLNLRYFLMFLLFTGMLINYVSYLSGFILLGMVEENGLWYYRDMEGLIQETPKGYIFQYLVYMAVPIVALFMFTVFIGLVVYGFLGYHLWLICRGTTTNETFKWSAVHRDRNAFLAQQAKKQRTTSIPLDEFEDASTAPYVRGKPLVNIYNRGILKNFFEVFFPLSTHTKHTFPSPPTTQQSSTQSSSAKRR
jgi:palmitoyltransferase